MEDGLEPREIFINRNLSRRLAASKYNDDGDGMKAEEHKEHKRKRIL